MQIAGERLVARHLAPAWAALVVTVLVSSCARDETPGAAAHTGPRATPAPGWSLQSVPRESLLAYGGRLEFDTAHSASDAQHLIVPATVKGGHPTIGPYAWLAPEIGTISLTREQLGAGRIIGRIVSGGAYAPLMLDSGLTYVWVDSGGPAAAWRIVLISHVSGTKLVAKPLLYHATGPRMRAMAFSMCRWWEAATSYTQPCCACEEWGWCTGDSTSSFSAI
jgi:hypothetical protein